jgi:hypothetical protein
VEHEGLMPSSIEELFPRRMATMLLATTYGVGTTKPTLPWVCGVGKASAPSTHVYFIEPHPGFYSSISKVARQAGIEPYFWIIYY